MNLPLQQRAGRNTPPRPAPFGVEVAQLGTVIRKVTEASTVIVKRELDGPPVVLALNLPLAYGYIINRTLGIINIEVYVVDAAGRKMLTASGPIPPGADVPLINNFLTGTGLPIWVLAPGESVVLEVIAGDLTTGNGFWLWPQKQVLDTRVETPRVLLVAGDAVVEPLPGHGLYPSSFGFENDFRANFVFNYSPTTATMVDVTLETEDGIIPVETVPCPAGIVTPLMTAFGVGWGLSHPNKLRVHLSGAAPVDGDIVYEGSYLWMDKPEGT